MATLANVLKRVPNLEVVYSSAKLKRMSLGAKKPPAAFLGFVSGGRVELRVCAGVKPAEVQAALEAPDRYLALVSDGVYEVRPGCTETSAREVGPELMEIRAKYVDAWARRTLRYVNTKGNASSVSRAKDLLRIRGQAFVDHLLTISGDNEEILLQLDRWAEEIGWSAENPVRRKISAAQQKIALAQRLAAREAKKEIPKHWEVLVDPEKTGAEAAAKDFLALPDQAAALAHVGLQVDRAQNITPQTCWSVFRALTLLEQACQTTENPFRAHKLKLFDHLLGKVRNQKKLKEAERKTWLAFGPYFLGSEAQVELEADVLAEIVAISHSLEVYPEKPHEHWLLADRFLEVAAALPDKDVFQLDKIFDELVFLAVHLDKTTRFCLRRIVQMQMGEPPEERDILIDRPLQTLRQNQDLRQIEALRILAVSEMLYRAGLRPMARQLLELLPQDFSPYSRRRPTCFRVLYRLASYIAGDYEIVPREELFDLSTRMLRQALQQIPDDLEVKIEDSPECGGPFDVRLACLNLFGGMLLFRFEAEKDQQYLTAAKDYFDRALKMERSPLTIINLARVAKLQGQVRVAESRYKEARKFSPSLYPAHTNLAELLFEQGREEEGKQALSQLQRQLELDLGAEKPILDTTALFPDYLAGIAELYDYAPEQVTAILDLLKNRYKGKMQQAFAQISLRQDLNFSPKVKEYFASLSG